MTAESIIENHDLREKLIKRIDVLDKVKKVICLPNTNLSTLKQVAEYYNVDDSAIRHILSRNINEFQEDGYAVFKKSEIIKKLSCQNFTLTSQAGKSILTFENNNVIEIPNRGTHLFTRRAVLRVGMLLRDSETAKEIRNYLLNVEETADEFTKTKVVHETIDKEDQLMLNIFHSKSQMEQILAVKALHDFTNEQIHKRDIKIAALVDGELTYDIRPAVNSMVRKLAGNMCNGQFGTAWNVVKRRLLYKYSINVKSRIEHCTEKHPTIFSVLSDEEMSLLVKTCVALCEEHKVDISEIKFIHNQAS